MDRLRSGRSRSIKRLSISVSLKSLDSRANIEKSLYSAGEQVSRSKYMIKNGRSLVTRFNLFFCQRRHTQMF